MKKIFKLVKEIGRYYRGYDLHVTKDHIEVKFTPHPARGVARLEIEEVVFVTDLSYDVMETFQFNLERHLNRLKEQ